MRIIYLTYTDLQKKSYKRLIKIRKKANRLRHNSNAGYCNHNGVEFQKYTQIIIWCDELLN